MANFLINFQAIYGLIQIEWLELCAVCKTTEKFMDLIGDHSPQDCSAIGCNDPVDVVTDIIELATLLELITKTYLHKPSNRCCVSFRMKLRCNFNLKLF